MTAPDDLTGKIAVVTGAGGDLGTEICRQLKQAGAVVHGLTRSSSVAHATPWTCDLTDPAQITRTFTSILEQSGQIDILINNAGAQKAALAAATDPALWAETLHLNLTAPSLCIREVLRPMMRQRSGSIVNISSLAASHPLPGQSAYSAAKGALESLTRSVALEVAGKNIRVNAVAPGFLDSRMVAAMDETKRAALLKKIPLARLGQLPEAAACVCFLASDRAAYITGQIFHVDGGLGM